MITLWEKKSAYRQGKKIFNLKKGAGIGAKDFKLAVMHLYQALQQGFSPLEEGEFLDSLTRGAASTGNFN